MRRLFVLSFKLYACIVVSLSIAGCNKKPGSDTTGISFSNTAIGYPLNVFINEASGIADSKINPGHLWVEEDSGNPPQLYLLDHTAATVKKIYIKDATNIDWEDIALASGPDASKKYLYIADIGDNNAVRASAVFYRLEEPAASTDTVRTYEVINFIYADGPRDAEAFLVDDITKDIYIISKRDAKSKLYKLSYPYSTASLNTAIL